eukprot:TRINITY_DN244_c0_g1_i1.p1 TRINITY_DN244_c0_g1~~TRINITY_DN244_c0_g1_i1.p1  ORF type:complete len:191 (-),score=25.88 TRINITY_DN244_c0_g1_i1:209-781(-)
MIGQEERETIVDRILAYFMKMLHLKLERYVLYYKARWLIAIGLVLVYLIRIWAVGGFYVISYSYGLYIIHLFVQFLTPMGLPDIDEEDDGQVVIDGLPTTMRQVDSDEFKPYVRTIGEFLLWKKLMLAGIVALVLTLTRAFDFPVFWPFLLFYFFFLCFLTVRKQFRHMAKYGYGFVADSGKRKYGGGRH